MQPLRFVIIGLDGFAQAHIQAVKWLEKQHLGKLTGVIVLKEDRRKQPELLQQLQQKDVLLFESIDDFWSHGVEHADVLAVPIGIHQHVPVSIAALEAGLHVYCEKPVAGTIQEVNQFIEAKKRTGKVVAIGFQHLFANCIQQLKQRICTGQLGKPKRATLVNGWPRSIEYFRRNDWAGRLQKNGKWILDSPANNAMAHYLMNLLYLASLEPDHAANPVWVQAELYRTNPIDSADTVQLQLLTDSGLYANVILTHATAQDIGPKMRLTFEKGEILWETHAGRATIFSADGKTETFENGDGPWRFEGFRNLAGAILRGDQVICPPEIARSHTLTINAMHESCPEIWPVEDAFVYQEKDWRIWPPNTRGNFYRIRNLQEHIQEAMTREKFLSELGVPWARAGRKFVVENYPFFPQSGGAFAQWQKSDGEDG